jgi:flagellar basal-body rod modification protein FlgD
MNELRFEMSPQERTARALETDRLNKQLFDGKTPVKDLGKDEFLTLLLAQLSHQDPTAPMEDREFISQMAQLNTLQQMTSMATDFNRLTELFTNSEAASSLGKSVELNAGEKVVQGTVKAVSRGGTPEVMVNGTYYPWDQVSRVFEE